MICVESCVGSGGRPSHAAQEGEGAVRQLRLLDGGVTETVENRDREHGSTKSRRRVK